MVLADSGRARPSSREPARQDGRHMDKFRARRAGSRNIDWTREPSGNDVPPELLLWPQGRVGRYCSGKLLGEDATEEGGSMSLSYRTP